MEIQIIDDSEALSRLIDFPSMYAHGETSLAVELVFTFPNGVDESLIWRKYKPNDLDVHTLGCARELAKRQYKPRARYTGFSSAIAGEIRNFRGRTGHGFDVLHAPEEGLHHVSVRYRPIADRLFTKSEKTELKVWIGALFNTVSRHNCEGAIVG